MRYKKEIEQKTAAEIDALIDAEACQSQSIVFYPPSYVVEVMAGMGYTVTKPYVIRRYNQIGVYNYKGLWVKRLWTPTNCKVW